MAPRPARSSGSAAGSGTALGGILVVKVPVNCAVLAALSLVQNEAPMLKPVVLKI